MRHHKILIWFLAGLFAFVLAAKCEYDEQEAIAPSGYVELVSSVNRGESYLFSPRDMRIAIASGKFHRSLSDLAAIDRIRENAIVEVSIGIFCLVVSFLYASPILAGLVYEVYRRAVLRLRAPWEEPLYIEPDEQQGGSFGDGEQ
jgi:hypothetical protein